MLHTTQAKRTKAAVNQKDKGKRKGGEHWSSGRACEVLGCKAPGASVLDFEVNFTRFFEAIAIEVTWELTDDWHDCTHRHGMEHRKLVEAKGEPPLPGYGACMTW